jgi:hypothetical protein
MGESVKRLSGSVLLVLWIAAEFFDQERRGIVERSGPMSLTLPLGEAAHSKCRAVGLDDEGV